MVLSYDAFVTTLQDQAKVDAERVLQNVWIGHRFPVDPVRIARTLGINVVDVELGQDVAGALVKEANRDPVILLNRDDSANRRRFTAAHELGHFIRRKDAEYDYVDRRDTLAALGQVPDEIYANSFAANLLMPDDAVRQLDREGVSDYEMALRFGVSREALGFRLANLGLHA